MTENPRIKYKPVFDPTHVTSMLIRINKDYGEWEFRASLKFKNNNDETLEKDFKASNYTDLISEISKYTHVFDSIDSCSDRK